MIPTLNLHDTAKRRVLSSRATARSITPVISELLIGGNGSPGLTIDLEHMATVTPSFFDELLHVIVESMSSRGIVTPVIDLTNTSQHQSRRFTAVCRAHDMKMARVGPDHWRISNA
jgi:hypothetical protein